MHWLAHRVRQVAVPGDTDWIGRHMAPLGSVRVIAALDREPLGVTPAAEAPDGVQRQIFCRAINEKIRELSPSLSCEGEIDAVCECDREGCFDSIRVAPVVYEDVRRHPTRFLVKVGHEAPARERAVGKSDRIVIVEKTRVEEMEAATRADPRHQPATEPVAGWMPGERTS